MRYFLVTFAIFASFCLVANTKEPCQVSAKLACYHYDPQHPYINAKQKELIQRVFDATPVCGSLRSSFFVASPEFSHANIKARCKALIPRNRSLLKMKALVKKREHSISFNEESRDGAFRRVVVIGDSLSDEGRAVKALQKLRHPVTGTAMMEIAKLIGCRIPEHFLEFGLKPYWNGTFSNGPMWPHYLSDLLDNVAVDNLSFGGLTTGLCKCHTIHLASMLKRHFKLNQSPEVVAENLYLIWVGANDYFYSGDLPHETKREQKRNEAVLKAIRDLEKSVETLIEHGAQHIVLFTVPNPNQSPKWCTFYENDKSACSTDLYKDEWKISVTRHNEKLRERFDAMSAEWGTKVSLFDIDALLESELHALDVDPNITWKEELAGQSHQESMQVAGYFDPVHPTTKVQCTIAKKIADHLRSLGLSNVDPLGYSCDEKIEKLLRRDA